MKRSSKKRHQSVVGLAFTEGQIRLAHVVRGKAGPEVVKTASAALSLDVLHPEAELVGREIKNHLDAAGIREHNCVVALPAGWVMSQHLKMPEGLKGDDATSFLDLEAEKGFPTDPSSLQIARSFHRSSEGEYVTQLAVRKEQLDQLSAVLKAAGLKPVSYSLGLAVLPDVVSPAGQGRITVAVDPASVTLLVSAGGGIAAFRTFDSSIDSEHGENVVNAASVARELRITFEQVSPDLRGEVRNLLLLGDSKMARHLSESLADWAEASSLRVSRGDLPEKNLGNQMAERLAVQYVEGKGELEFLPPRPSRWQMLMTQYATKRYATIGYAVGGVLAILLIAFLWQGYELWSLQSDWDGMHAQVSDLNSVQDKIREFRPFFDTSFHSLTVLKRVTECFPENGSVTAKTLEIHSGNQVSVSGSARDYASLLRTLDALRKLKEVEGVKLDQARGKTPSLQFTFTFRWNLGT